MNQAAEHDRQPIRVRTPLDEKTVAALEAGDRVLLTGVLHAARDAAHKRFAAALAEGSPLPFDPRGQIIYYVGPTPPKPGRVIGSAGPTTSSRMDPYTPALIAAGLRGMVGKGDRSPEVVAAMREHGAVYFAAVGGLGALLGMQVRRVTVLAYDDLGTEALRRLEVEDFPLIVAVDARGRDLYSLGREAYNRY